MVSALVAMGSEDAAPPAAAAGGWSAMARKDAVVPVKVKVEASAVRSKSGLSTIVVDTNAVIGSGMHLVGTAERFVTLREVLEEVRDPMSRMNLAALPIKLEVLEPDSEAVTKVIQFAKATGDLQSLSEVDLKLIALAYTLESEIHGVSHLRKRPPPLQVTTVQQKKQRDPPGWGSNVSNMKEWEQLSEAENKLSKSNKVTQSKILGLKYLNLDGSEAEKAPLVADSEGASLPADPVSNESEAPSTAGTDSQAETKPGPRGGRPRREKREPKPKPVYSIEGKKNVAVGVDASKTEAPEEDTSDWVHACSRTTRRKFLKREAKRQARAAENSETSSVAANSETTETETQPKKSFFDEAPELPPLVDEDEDEDGDENENVADDATDEAIGEDDTETPVLDIESGKVPNEEEGASGSEDDEEVTRAFEAEMAAHAEVEGEELQTDGQESNAGTEGGVAPSSVFGSEDCLIMDPSWQSSVACATGDFAMQNVILQMGLRLLSPSGVHVRELSRFVLKCTACNNITAEVGRIFCPKCGNGGTLYKVSVTVGANGSVHAGQIKRVNLRGTRYSLPLPKGGRVGAAQNPILREDQLPHRVLHPKQKKSSSKAAGDVYVTADTLFTNNKGMQNIGLMPAVQQAAAVFGGRRNPNERRNNRKH
ncbi:hypothetical protein KC19_9G100800 [Ceratodon purpureus]|uniref:RNA-binding protein NOB1 n=1 Tax=Ceratodon purpureus TaxID=3225 RepID=A0A8T0GW12_CERPU|nr:hypothetical protein KC19_9G100800 [Ceratodon purpureus]